MSIFEYKLNEMTQYAARKYTYLKKNCDNYLSRCPLGICCTALKRRKLNL